MAENDHSQYEKKYRAYYDAGVPFVSTRGYDEEYKSFLSNRSCRGRLIDCGCGEGFAAAMAAGLGYDVLGVDSAPSAVARATETHTSKYKNLRFEVCDVCELSNVKSDYYDILTDIGCLHMIGNPQDAQNYMSNAFRVVKPNGFVYLQNRVTSEEARVWFPAKAKWIDDWVQSSKGCVTDTVREVICNGDHDVLVDVPIRLGAVSRNVSQYVALVTRAGFMVEHTCVKNGGVNSPFELVLIASKPGS